MRSLLRRVATALVRLLMVSSCLSKKDPSKATCFTGFFSNSIPNFIPLRMYSLSISIGLMSTSLALVAIESSDRSVSLLSLDDSDEELSISSCSFMLNIKLLKSSELATPFLELELIPPCSFLATFLFSNSKSVASGS